MRSKPQRHLHRIPTYLCPSDGQHYLGLTSKQNFFFCTEVIDDHFLKKELKKPVERQRTVYYVRGMGVKDIVNKANERKDMGAKEVNIRLSTVSDLVAADRVYHLSLIHI